MKYGYKKAKCNVSFHPQHFYDVVLRMRNVNFTGNKIMGPLHIFGTDKETLQIWYVGA